MNPASVVGTVVGVGLMAAPAVLGYADSGAADVQRTAGPVIASLALMAFWGVLRGVRWAMVVPALVLAGAPVSVDHSAGALAVSLLAAVATSASVPFEGRPTEPTGGGWRSLRPSRDPSRRRPGAR